MIDPQTVRIFKNLKDLNNLRYVDCSRRQLGDEYVTDFAPMGKYNLCVLWSNGFVTVYQFDEKQSFIVQETELYQRMPEQLEAGCLAVSDDQKFVAVSIHNKLTKSKEKVILSYLDPDMRLSYANEINFGPKEKQPETMINGLNMDLLVNGDPVLVLKEMDGFRNMDAYVFNKNQTFSLVKSLPNFSAERSFGLALAENYLVTVDRAGNVYSIPTSFGNSPNQFGGQKEASSRSKFYSTNRLNRSGVGSYGGPTGVDQSGYLNSTAISDGFNQNRMDGSFEKPVILRQLSPMNAGPKGQRRPQNAAGYQNERFYNDQRQKSPFKRKNQSSNYSQQDQGWNHPNNTRGTRTRAAGLKEALGIPSPNKNRPEGQGRRNQFNEFNNRGFDNASLMGPIQVTTNRQGGQFRPENESLMERTYVIPENGMPNRGTNRSGIPSMGTYDDSLAGRENLPPYQMSSTRGVVFDTPRYDSNAVNYMNNDRNNRIRQMGGHPGSHNVSRIDVPHRGDLHRPQANYVPWNDPGNPDLYSQSNGLGSTYPGSPGSQKQPAQTPGQINLMNYDPTTGRHFDPRTSKTHGIADSQGDRMLVTQGTMRSNQSRGTNRSGLNGVNGVTGSTTSPLNLNQPTRTVTNRALTNPSVHQSQRSNGLQNSQGLSSATKNMNPYGSPHSGIGQTGTTDNYQLVPVEDQNTRITSHFEPGSIQGSNRDSQQSLMMRQNSVVRPEMNRTDTVGSGGRTSGHSNRGLGQSSRTADLGSNRAGMLTDPNSGDKSQLSRTRPRNEEGNYSELIAAMRGARKIKTNTDLGNFSYSIKIR